MTLTAPPLQLALALDVVFDAPTAREYADVKRKLGALLIGDALLFDGGRVERAMNASDAEYYRLKWGGVTVGTWYVVAAASLARIQREILARLMALGVKAARVSPYDAELLCDDPAEDEDDFMLESMQCGSFRQEALVTVPMRIEVYGFDDEEVTLGDGTIDVLQLGSPFKVSGSRSFMRDPRLSRLNPAQTSRAIRQAARIGLPLMSAPAHLKWCSEHPTPKHVDQRLLMSDPVAYWAQHGFVPRYQFGDSPKVNGKPKYKDGKLPVCKECRARHERMMYAAIKAQQGQPVRGYRNHGRPKYPTRMEVA